MKLAYANGATSAIVRVKILDSTSTTGAGKTGLTHASSGLIISTIASNESTATTYTAAASNVETITTLGTFAAPTSGKCRFKEVDATNHPGLYEIQFADARFAVSNARHLIGTVQVTGGVQVDFEIQLENVPSDVKKWTGTAVELSGGYPSVHVYSMRGGALTATATDTSFVNLVADGVWDEAQAGHTTDGTFGKYADAQISTRSTHSAADVWAVATRTLSAFSFSVTVGTNNDKTGYSLATAPPTAAAIADAVWDEVQSGHTTSGTFGKYLDYQVSLISGGGGGSVVVNPIVAAAISRVDGDTLRAFTGETATFVVAPVDADGDSVDVSGMTLEIVIEDSKGNDLQTILNGSITKTSTYYQFSTSTANANPLVNGKWSCRVVSTDVVINHGPYIVDYAAQGD